MKKILNDFEIKVVVEALEECKLTIEEIADVIDTKRHVVQSINVGRLQYAKKFYDGDFPIMTAQKRKQKIVDLYEESQSEELVMEAFGLNKKNLYRLMRECGYFLRRGVYYKVDDK